MLLGQQKTLVGTYAAGNCSLKTGTLVPKAALSQVRQRRGVTGAGYHRRQNGPAGGPQHVAGNITQFDVCALQRLLEPICLSCPLAHQGGAIARQFAQLALRSIWHEAWTQQPMAKQVSDPLAVLNIGLPTGHLLDVLRVGQHQREALFK